MSRALVTGGGSGIGRTIALALADAGHDVVICGRSAERFASVDHHRITAQVADVTDPGAIAALYAAHGPFDIVVANAGGTASAPAAKVTLADWQASLALNLTGAFLTVQPALATMVAAKAGRIVFVASTAGLKGYPYVAPYVAAKHGVVGLMRALAAETATSGVTVNAVCPGFAETDLLDRSLAAISAKTGRSESEARAALANPQGRFVTPDEVAATVLWLVSDAARSVTGQAIAISGRGSLKPQHFQLEIADRVARVRLNNPARKNPLTFDSYAELRDWFRGLADADDVDAVVILPNGGNFCSGGDVHDIIGPLVAMDMKGLLRFTRMTGDLVKAMLACNKPIIAAVDGVAVGAGAIMAMASDLRLATPEAKTAFLFTRVGLAGCDMGACAMLPRIIGQGRAAELLYTGRTMGAEEGERWGFYNRLVAADALEGEALALAAQLVAGPTFAHGITKTQLNQEWSMGLDQAIEAEAQAQAICMQTRDFERAYRAFVAKAQPVFEGD